MSSGPRTAGPRHLAGGAPRRSPRPAPRPIPRSDRPGPRHRPRRAPAPAPRSTPAPAPVEAGELAPLARVKRSRLAFAVSATVAALPVLIADNLPATAAQDHEVQTVAAEATPSSTTEAPTSSSSDDPTTTVVEVAVTEAEAEVDAVEETTTSAVAEPSTSTEPPPTSAAPVATLAAAAPEPAPETTTTPAPSTTAPAAGYAYGDPDDPATWDRLAQCESGGNWALNTGNGYYGGLQFSLATWQDVGGSGYPHEHSRAEQIHRGQILQSRYGWGQWPHCSSQLGYR